MSSTKTPKLFTPLILGTMRLRHRIVMAPLTRLRSEQPGDIPGDLMAEYYAQRASPGGLIVTESTEITPEASAYEGAPGIYTEAQMVGWRKVADAIHKNEGYVFLQLWHPGRVSHPALTGVAPVSSSATESIFNGPIIAAGGFDREGAIKIVENGDADLVAFGRQFISNPDLPERLRLGIPLNAYNRETFYSPGPEGYIDYPSHSSGTVK